MLTRGWWRLINVVLSPRKYSRFTRSIRADVTLSRGKEAMRSSVSLRVPAATRHGRSTFSGRRIPISIGFAEGLAPSDEARCRIAEAVYAPASMTDLKVSVTASIGMQARHRTPPLQL